MGMNDFKKKKKCRCHSAFHTLPLVGIILMAFGATTLCAFLLPVKIWVFFLGIVLLLCGVLLLMD
jgi:uncharacterized membrane protein HdeD (DUF308 family)